MTTEILARPMVGKPALAREIGTTSRTIDRWAADPSLNFPCPIKIKRRVFFFRDDIEKWKSSRVRASVKFRGA